MRFDRLGLCCAVSAFTLAICGCSHEIGHLPPSAALTVSPASLSFTGVSEGVATTPQTVTVANNGSATVSISSIGLTGSGTSNFSLTSLCGTTLGPGASCPLSVIYTPSGSSTSTASLVLTDDASSSPQTVSLTGTPPAVVASARFAYVGNDDSTISMYTIESDGTWNPTTPATVSLDSEPLAMAAAPNGKFLYAASFISGILTTFSITPGTGVLVPISSYNPNDLNARPEEMTIDPKGRFLYVSNTGENTVAIYDIDPTTGIASPASPATVVTDPDPDASPNGITVAPGGNFLYVANGGDGNIAMFSIDQTTGVPSPLSPAIEIAPAESFVLRFNITGQQLYSLQSRATGLDTYNFDSSSGQLTQTFGTTMTGQGPTDLRFTPDGKYAYVADRDGNTMSEYSVDPTNGALTSLGSGDSTFPVPGNEPFVIFVDPLQKLVYIGCEGSGVLIMSIASNGTLTYGQLVPDTRVPISLQVVP